MLGYCIHTESIKNSHSLSRIIYHVLRATLYITSNAELRRFDFFVLLLGPCLLILLKGSVKEQNMFHNYETEKITRKASDAAENLQ